MVLFYRKKKIFISKQSLCSYARKKRTYNDQDNCSDILVVFFYARVCPPVFGYLFKTFFLSFYFDRRTEYILWSSQSSFSHKQNRLVVRKIYDECD